jgi:hypothetical protein
MTDVGGVLSTPSEPQSDADYEAAIAEVLAEIRCLNEKMEHNRVRIERSKALTAASSRRTDAILADIDARLKAMSAAS